MERRKFLKIAGLGSVACVAGLRRRALASAGGRPNVLLLFSDQHNADVLGCAGHAVVKTPHLDALARRGVRFTRAYCQDGICVPSRTCMMTGLYPRTTGCLHNSDQPLRPGRFHAIQHVLRRHGYRTGCFGKRHLPHDGELATGWDRSATTINPRLDPSDENYNDWVRQRGQWDAHKRDFGGHLKSDLASHISQVREGNRTSTYVADKTLAFLKEAKEAGKAFFCWSSFIFPHQPYTPLKRWADLYPPERVPLPASLNEPADRLPPILRSWRGNERQPWNLAKAAREPGIYRRYIAYYMALVSEVDHQIGRILAGLDATGLRDETVVIYAADHGDFVGGHGMVEKCAVGHNVYEETLRVPLILAWPARFRKGAVYDGLVGLLDLYPTLVDLLGLKRPADAPALPGRSLLGVLTDGKPIQRTYAISENWSQVTVITDRYKLGVWIDATQRARHWDCRGKHPDMLFDRQNDPHELTNLIGRPEHAAVEKRLRAHLAEWMKAAPDTGRREVAAKATRKPQRRRSFPLSKARDIRPDQLAGLGTAMAVTCKHNELDVAKVTVGGVEAWRSRTRRTQGKLTYFYFRAPKKRFGDGKAPHVALTVVFRDVSDTTLQVVYDSSDASWKHPAGAGVWKEAGGVRLGNSGTWKAVTFDIRDARFSNRCNGQDVRLNIKTPAADPVVLGVYLKAVGDR